MSKEETEEEFLKRCFGDLHVLTKYFLADDEKRVGFAIGGISMQIYERLKYNFNFDALEEEIDDAE